MFRFLGHRPLPSQTGIPRVTQALDDFGEPRGTRFAVRVKDGTMSSIALLGASGTIGSVLARRLVAAERSVILLGRDESKLAPLAAELGQPYDVVDWTQSQSLEQTLEARIGQGIVLGGIVNCIGSVLLKGAHATSDDEFRATLETNLFTAFSAVRAAAKLLRKNGGSVVLFASAAAEIGIANHEAIAAAKAGIIGLARSASATYAQHNIRFNVVSPGLIRTELTRRIWSNPASSAASESMHALKRLGEPEQVASLVQWLLDPLNDWVTGQVYGVDGGLGHVMPRRS